MTKFAFAPWGFGRALAHAGLTGVGVLALSACAGAAADEPPVRAAAVAAHPAAAAPARPSLPPARWHRSPRIAGHLKAKDVAVVINTLDPYSVTVGEYYAKARGLSGRQVLRVALPVKAALTPEEFEVFQGTLTAELGTEVQAVALAWRQPYAVACNSISGALALGFDPGLCQHSCEPSRASPYFDNATARPFTDARMRLSMLLAASDVEGAKRLIDRGVAADRSLGWRGAPPVQAHYLLTHDRIRSVRALDFPPAGLLRSQGVELRPAVADRLGDQARRVLIYQTGLSSVEGLAHIDWVPGALADHLTSFGGQIVGQSGQMSALAWIDGGATASHGAVSEPCSHRQKFPQPQVLLLHYLQGATAIEAYWKSVAWPQQSLFVGEPLAAPFAR
ncbi:MAG: hypothetical protein RJA98_2662 [Pseudomonadota bacterium]|jgi:uncharacterized protein (TIGR03790 family)